MSSELDMLRHLVALASRAIELHRDRRATVGSAAEVLEATRALRVKLRGEQFDREQERQSWKRQLDALRKEAHEMKALDLKLIREVDQRCGQMQKTLEATVEKLQVIMKQRDTAVGFLHQQVEIPLDDQVRQSTWRCAVNAWLATTPKVVTP